MTIEKSPIQLNFDGEELAKALFYYGLIDSTSSSEQKIICPFHNDVNPSMKVNLYEGTYFCFGCGETGDSFKFVKTLNKGMNDLESCLKYVQILKSKKCEHIDLSNRQKKNRKSDKVLWNIAADYYYGLKTIDWVSDDAGLGFGPEYDMMIDEIIECGEYMEKRGFSGVTLNKCKAKVTFNESYPIIFPMFDNRIFKGWVSRTTKREIEKKRKYLYNEGFSRASTLVGEYAGKKVVYLVEGYMDRAKMIQNGNEDAVAILGWKVTPEQIQKLKDAGVELIVSALDNDVCGVDGTKFLKKNFEVVRFEYDKSIKDPGEMDRKQYETMNRRTMENVRRRMAQLHI